MRLIMWDLCKGVFRYYYGVFLHHDISVDTSDV